MTADERSGLLFIDGDRREAVGGQTLTSWNPSTGEPFAAAAFAGPDDVDAAVSSAQRTHQDGVWAQATPDTRAGVLARAAALVDAETAQIAETEAAETGKPITLALSDVSRTAAFLMFCSSLPYRALGSDLGRTGPWSSSTTRVPHGVVAAIAPWNFAFRMGAMKTAPAIALGNSVVLKTSELAPVSGGLIAGILSRAGLPPGVLNIVHGDGPVTGQHLVSHPRVRKVTFTGSVTTGRAIAVATARRLVPAHLELGGKAAAVLFDDADLETAVTRAVSSALVNSGQICTAPSRFLVHRPIMAEVVERIRAHVSREIRIGPADDPQTTMGPLISRQQQDRVQNYVARAEARGLTNVVADLPAGASERGYFVSPAVFTEVPADDELFTEEIFGPVLTITPFDDDDEAITLANQVDYGLSACVFTTSTSRRRRALEELQVGTVWINSVTSRPSHSPFEGDKDSGYGVEGGAEAVATFTKLRTHIEQHS